MNFPSQTRMPFGLFELDQSGQVIRYSPAAEQHSDVKAQDVLGRQFFTEVLPDRQVKDFEPRFQLFMEQGQSIDRFSTNLPSAEGEIKVQFLLARIAKKSKQYAEHLALVRIMPAA